MTIRLIGFGSWCLATLLATSSTLFAADQLKVDAKAAVDPASVESIAIEPGTVTLRGRDSVQQVFVTAKITGEVLRDLTKKGTYTSSDEKVARVDAEGIIYP